MQACATRECEVTGDADSGWIRWSRLSSGSGARWRSQRNSIALSSRLIDSGSRTCKRRFVHIVRSTGLSGRPTCRRRAEDDPARWSGFQARESGWLSESAHEGARPRLYGRSNLSVPGARAARTTQPDHAAAASTPCFGRPSGTAAASANDSGSPSMRRTSASSGREVGGDDARITLRARCEQQVPDERVRLGRPTPRRAAADAGRTR